MKRLALILAVVFVITAFCSCSQNGASSLNSSVSKVENKGQRLSSESESSNKQDVLTISSMEELEYDKITKLSVYVLGEEKFIEDKTLINKLCSAVKTAKPNPNVTEATSPNGELICGGCNVIYAYCDSHPVYSFSGFASEENYYLVTSFLTATDYTLYCNISKEDFEKMCEVAASIYDMYAEDVAEQAR